MPSQSPNEFVITSSVRTEIVLRVSEETTPTDALLSESTASDSAVYDALSTLRERGLLTESDGGWELTAHGHLGADSVSAWRASEEFLARDPAFWKNHRIDVIPAPFRRRLPEVGEYEIVRDAPEEPNRSEDVAISMIESADYCELTTPYYSRRHQAAIPRHPKTRLLVTREAIDVSFQRYKDGHREELNNLEPATIRLTDCQFASVVTDEKLKFELPTLSESKPGRHDGPGGTDPSERGSVADSTALFVSETESAVQLGRDLFEMLWAESDPLGPYIEREFPELLE
jgi:predicted transcriptional regulator